MCHLLFSLSKKHSGWLFVQQIHRPMVFINLKYMLYNIKVCCYNWMPLKHMLWLNSLLDLQKLFPTLKEKLIKNFIL